MLVTSFLYCPLGKLESEDIYIVVGIKKSRRIGDMDSQQHILAKNEKTGLYKCLYFDRDIGLNEKYCWLNAYKFISEDEYSTIKYNL